MFTFFKFLLLLFLGFLLFLFILGWSLFKNIRRIIRPFNGQQQSRNTSSSSSYSRAHTSSSGTVIIDERTEKNAGRRIIPDDEGEYVDYEETK